jgi:hypothetical protein
VSGRGGKLIATKAGYKQPCRVPVKPGINNDVYLVSDATLAATGVPSSMLVLEPRLSGRVFERTSQGPQPVPGASLVLDFTGGDGWAPSATTMSDAMGRYMLCGVAKAYFFFPRLYASAPAFAPADVSINIPVTGDVDIELTRR